MKSLLLFFALAFLLLGCQKGERAQRELDSLRSKAYAQKASGELVFAIDSFQRLIATDSLRANTYRFELLTLYEQLGNFRDALYLIDTLLSSSPPADSLSRLKEKKITLLALLGEIDALQKQLRQTFPLTPEHEYLLAEIYLQKKDYERARYHFSLLTQSQNAHIAIESLGKLATCFDYEEGSDHSELLVQKMLDKLAEQLPTQSSIEEKFNLLYRSARILAENDAFASVADSLFTNALDYLTNPKWRGKNPDMLSAWITIEQSCITTPQSQPLEQALLTFRLKDHRLGEAAATLLLGKCTDYDPNRRINLLLKALERFEALTYPQLPNNIIFQLDDVSNDLLSLLLQQERLLEAFEVSERLKTLKQRFSTRLTFTRSHTSNFKALEQLQRDIFAITVMKDSLAFLADDAQRNEQNQFLAETLAKKQGEFYQKLLELQSVSMAEAELLAPKPMLLSETQRYLSPDDVLVQFFFGQVQSYFIVITDSKIHIVRSPLIRNDIKQLFKTIQFELLNGLPFDSTAVIENRTRQMLTTLILNPILPFLSERTQVYVMSNMPCPIHILGKQKLLGETHRVSYLTSTKQLQLAKFASPFNTPLILSLDEIDAVPFDLFESPQEALLEWGRLDEQLKSVCKTLSRPIAESYYRFARSQSVQNQYAWINFSCYGK